MARTGLDEVAGLTVAEVVHSRFSTLPGDSAVGAVREWFAASTSHNLALLADDGRYVGSLVPADVADADAGRAAAELARREPTVGPGDPAARGKELALATPALRVPVVDDDGRVVGIVAITADLQGFCGTDPSTGC